MLFYCLEKDVGDMKVWNKLIDKFDLLLMKVKLGSTVKIGGRDIPPVFMGLALIII